MRNLIIDGDGDDGDGDGDGEMVMILYFLCFEKCMQIIWGILELHANQYSMS